MNFQPIHVICTFRGFKTEALKYPLTPHSFELPGRTVKIKEIRRHITQTVGAHKHYHYVVMDHEDRHYHLVFDQAKHEWLFIQEIPGHLFFDQLKM